MELFARALATERLLLRPYQKGDAYPMFQNWASDPDVTQFLSWNAHASVHQTQKRVDYMLIYQQAPRHYSWVITLANEPIGAIDVTAHYGDGGCSLGYCLGKKWWNHGYMSEAFHQVLAFLFSEADYRYVRMEAIKENSASRRVLLKQGFHFDHEENQFLGDKNKNVTLFVYLLKKEEFMN